MSPFDGSLTDATYEYPMYWSDVDANGCNRVDYNATMLTGAMKLSRGIKWQPRI
jgi:hypothetical protein